MTDRIPPRTAARCPGQQALADLYAGRLSDAAAEGVAAHLDDCPRCLNALSALCRAAPSPLDDRLTRCMKIAPFVDEPSYRAMEARAKALHSPDAASTPAEGHSRRTVFGGRGTFAIGRYEVHATIGEGGMGVVYRARLAALNRVVALKMVRSDYYCDPDAVARFHTEGMAAARLQHPNIVQLYDFDEHHGVPYYTMELVDGESLSARLAAGVLPPRDAAALIRDLAGAVDYAHGRRVVHRDLKPSNILLTAAGTPKVSDFGLAKLLDGGNVFLTATDVIMGTPSYMAPEQAGGVPGAVGPAADVYALGAILYECLSGRPPFLGGTKIETLRLVAETDPPPPSSHRRDVPRALDAVCLKCLEKEPKRRYASAGELAADLGRWLAGERVAARGRSRLWRAVRGARVRTAAAGAALVIGVGALGAAALYPRPPAAGPPPAAAPEEPPPALAAALAAGKPVQLIGETGQPAWHCWKTGAGRSQASVEPDGTFSAHTQGIGLLELLPDSGSDRYRLSAQIRHDQSGASGEIGLYVGRRSYPRQPGEIHFFTQLSFNAVRGVPQGVVPAKGENGYDGTSAIDLFPRLYSEDGPRHVGSRMPGVRGPRFHPLGTRNGAWFDLEATATPAGVTATLDGHPLALPVETIAGAVETGLKYLKQPPHNADPAIARLRPEFAPRGGLGLILWNGSAAVRNVCVTPLVGGE